MDGVNVCIRECIDDALRDKEGLTVVSLWDIGDKE